MTHARQVTRYAQEVLTGEASVARERYFREYSRDVPDAVKGDLRKLAMAELLRLSTAVEFDTVFLSVAAAVVTLDMPLPSALPNLRRLVVREDLYNLSPAIIAAAEQLQWLELESDEVVRADGSDFLQQVENKPSLRVLVLRRLNCGANAAVVQRAFQRLKSTALTELSLSQCGDFPLASVVGFLLKRMESLTTFSLDMDNVPTSVFGNLAGAETVLCFLVGMVCMAGWGSSCTVREWGIDGCSPCAHSDSVRAGSLRQPHAHLAA
jgi:hypothetical protein